MFCSLQVTVTDGRMEILYNFFLAAIHSSQEHVNPGTLGLVQYCDWEGFLFPCMALVTFRPPQNPLHKDYITDGLTSPSVQSKSQNYYYNANYYQCFST